MGILRRVRTVGVKSERRWRNGKQVMHALKFNLLFTAKKDWMRGKMIRTIPG